MRASDAKILNPDGREIATALLTLSSDGTEGWFELNSQVALRHDLDGKIYPELLADLGTHRHRLRNAKLAVDKPIQASLTADPFDEEVVNYRVYFECAD